MRILVTGSTPTNASPAPDPAFTKACKELGEALARSGHELVAGSRRVGVADRYVLEGANSVSGRHRVHLYRPEQGETPYDVDHNPLENLEFQYKGRQRGTWTVARVAQILAADGIIVIGGTDGTRQIGYTAPLLGRPVLAIPSFGGAASEIWAHLEKDYQRVPSVQPLVGSLREAWNSRTAGLAVRATEELVRRNPYAASQRWLLPLLGTLSIVLLGVWVTFFLRPPVDNGISFFVLLGAAALAGTMLRSTLRLLQNQTSVTVSTVALEALVAVLLSFGLALAYMAGSLTITGTPGFAQLRNESDYQRIGVVMSLIGLGAGFLIEQGAERLRSLLGQTLSGPASE